MVFCTIFARVFQQNRTDEKMAVKMSTIHQVDLVLKYVKELINSGHLAPSERLPAERRLATQLNVGRAQVRMAFQKLEKFGIVKTYPQSGTSFGAKT